MQAVGLTVMPKAPITLVAHDDACLKVDSSFMDGKKLQFYVRNTCSKWLLSPNYSFRLKSRDGTVVGSRRYAYDGDTAIGPQERREQGVETDDDGRIESVELWVIDGR